MNDTDLCQMAYDFAVEKHKGQKDDDGNPYVSHPYRVAKILSQVTNDEELIVASFLHDTLEDTTTTLEELKEKFGERIANLVYEVTHERKNDTKGYYFPRLKSRDAILIKFADRLDNLSRMDSWDNKRKEHYLKHSKFWRSEV